MILNKKMLYTLLISPAFFIMLASSCEKPKGNSRPTVIHISGIVTDKQIGTTLDSVKIYLYIPTMGGPTIKSFYYSDNTGRFTFQFSPIPNTSYRLSFEKKNYCYSGCQSIAIDLDKEYQEFNVQLEK
jgi:tRNA A37 threonylcarbamoyltransferase TsaD